MLVIENNFKHFENSDEAKASAISRETNHDTTERHRERFIDPTKHDDGTGAVLFAFMRANTYHMNAYYRSWKRDLMVLMKRPKKSQIDPSERIL